MTTAEFEKIAKEFGKLKYWEKSLNQIRAIRKTPNYWSVKFHNTLTDLDIALPCTTILDVLERIEDNITDEYEKQKQICDSISLPYELKTP
jgi:hypothetical protein